MSVTTLRVSSAGYATANRAPQLFSGCRLSCRLRSPSGITAIPTPCAREECAPGIEPSVDGCMHYPQVLWSTTFATRGSVAGPMGLRVRMCATFDAAGCPFSVLLTGILQYDPLPSHDIRTCVLPSAVARRQETTPDLRSRVFVLGIFAWSLRRVPSCHSRTCHLELPRRRAPAPYLKTPSSDPKHRSPSAGHADRHHQHANFGPRGYLIPRLCQPRFRLKSRPVMLGAHKMCGESVFTMRMSCSESVPMQFT
jgi:hypothetical protein